MTRNEQVIPGETRDRMTPGTGDAAARTGEVLIVDERRPIAQSLAVALGGLGMTVTTMIEPGLDGSVPAPPAPECGTAILDAGIGAPGDAPALARSLVAAGWTVLVLSRPADLLTAAACIEAGAAAHLSAGASLEDVTRVVCRVRDGREVGLAAYERDRLLAMLRETRSASARLRRPFRRLTPRERQVLGRLMDGCRAEDIATEAFVSVSTVRNQIQSVLTKLGVRSRLEAVALTRRTGWSPDDPA